ncbi:30S ribosomal protein S31, mitochondrial [Actinidia eriantha]|uniref:30S ribosomal protein S31, mitochondrial n=1 Tax=Actinidia eriantha TaxID=165200 RepID=UPI002583F8D4|nr:30S ribosomal protein S31, mitochondrial [Actinidia eriantha]
MMQWCGAVARRVMMADRTASISSLSSSSAFSSLSSLAATSSPAFTSLFPAAAVGLPIVCGRGDKKTKRGKRFKGSYGNARPKKEKKIERIKDKVEVPRSTPWPLPFKLI